jgi:hypothetical protein
MFDLFPTEAIPQPETDAIRAKVWELLSSRQAVRMPPTTLSTIPTPQG